jgi:hypothetical protein
VGHIQSMHVVLESLPDPRQLAKAEHRRWVRVRVRVGVRVRVVGVGLASHVPYPCLWPYIL